MPDTGETRQATAGLTFYLGTHETSWLTRARFPLFISHMRLRKRRTLPRATLPWALDSGGFTQLQQHGAWEVTPGEYVAATRRYADEIGRLGFAAPQDWMCEPFMIERTGLTVAEHQRRTVASYLQLRTLDAALPFIPVLQGFTRDDYLRCADLYEYAGVNLAAEPRVGLGSVCRRQDTATANEIVRSLAPLRLHGFGVKTTGLLRYGHRLASADSLAWSFNARKNPPLPGHPHHSCANCLPWATAWRHGLMTGLNAAAAQGRQGDLFDPDETWSAA